MTFSGGLSTTKAIRLLRYSSGICSSLVETARGYYSNLIFFYCCSILSVISLNCSFCHFTVYITGLLRSYLMGMCQLCLGGYGTINKYKKRKFELCRHFYNAFEFTSGRVLPLFYTLHTSKQSRGIAVMFYMRASRLNVSLRIGNGADTIVRVGEWKAATLFKNILQKLFILWVVIVKKCVYRISSNLSDTSITPDTLLGNFRCSNTTDTPVL